MSETKIDDGGPAYPFVSHGGIHEHQCCDQGMSLRDYFAAHAPDMPAGWTGVVDDAERMTRADDKVYRLIEWRWFYADQMIQARKATR